MIPIPIPIIQNNQQKLYKENPTMYTGGERILQSRTSQGQRN